MTANKEPRFARLLLQLLVPKADAEFLLGDLSEDYERIECASGPAAARAWYRRQVLATIGARARRRRASLDGLQRDARLALRRVRREPGYSFVTVATVALGIGGTIAVSALASTVLRPLPLPDAQELVAVWETNAGQQRWVAPANYLDWRRSTKLFEGLGAHDTRSVSITVEGSASREQVAVVSGNYFSVLDVEPSRGRTFDPSVNIAFSEREAVLSHEGSLRAFGSSSDAIGRTILIADQSYVVVGVMSPGFSFPDRNLYAWIRSPTEAPDIGGFPGDLVGLRDAWYFQVVGRLAQGSTIEAARAEMEAIADRLSAQYPETNEDSGVQLIPLLEQTVADFGRVLMVLSVAVGLILLAATFTVLHLTLSRSELRRTDIAVRVSLGASNADIRRSLLVEGWLLGLMGAAGGIALAVWSLKAAVNRLGGSIPRAEEVGVTLLLGVVACVIGVVIGSLVATAAYARSGLGREARSNLHRKAGAGARSLVAIHVAVSIAILTGAVLLSSTFAQLGRVDLGFDEEALMTLRLALPDGPARPYTERLSIYEGVADAVLALPGVTAVGLGSDAPISMGTRAGVFVVGTESDSNPPDSGWQPITPGYFSALGMTLLRGRDFTGSDGPDADNVAVVNEAFVRTVLGQGDPLGARVTMGLDGHDRPLTIVGVVSDTRTRGPAVSPGPVLYRPIQQTVRFSANSIFLAARTSGGGDDPAAAILQTVRRVAPGLPIYDEARGQDLIEPFRSTQTMLLIIMVVFACTAMAVGLVGVYGVGMHAVRRNRREIGVRLALGATAHRVTSEVLARAMRAAVLGVPPGLVLAVIVGRSMEGLLFGVGAADLSVLATAAGTVLLLTASASIAPARLAAATDPARSTKEA